VLWRLTLAAFRTAPSLGGVGEIALVHSALRESPLRL